MTIQSQWVLWPWPSKCLVMKYNERCLCERWLQTWSAWNQDRSDLTTYFIRQQTASTECRIVARGYLYSQLCRNEVDRLELAYGFHETLKTNTTMDRDDNWERQSSMLTCRSSWEWFPSRTSWEIALMHEMTALKKMTFISESLNAETSVSSSTWILKCRLVEFHGY